MSPQENSINKKIKTTNTIEYDGDINTSLKNEDMIRIFDNTDNMIDIPHIDIPGEADLMFRIRIQDIDNDGNLELVNDKKNLANDWGQIWEWNGTKFIKVP